MSGRDSRPVRLRRLAQLPGARFRGGPEDPLAGAANLADLMLVFATGLLVALVLAWDLARALDPSLSERVRLMQALRSAREVESLDRAPGERQPEVEGVGRYRSVGQVYRDTTTGKLFVVEEN